MTMLRKTKILLAAFIMSLFTLFVLHNTGDAQDVELPTPPRFELIEPQLVVPKPPQDLGALIVPVEQNDAAPFEGVLINQEGISWIMTNFVHVQRLLLLEMEHQVSVTRLWAETELRLAHTQHTTDVRAHSIRLEGMERSRDRLQEELGRVSREIGWSLREKVVLIVSIVGALAAGVVVGWAVSKLP